jgi:hypothetical protein
MDDVLTETQVRRVYALTDDLKLHRDWVVVPLRGSEQGLEMLLPDGKLLIRPAAGSGFEGWFNGLKARLEGLDLNRPLRAGQQGRHYPHVPPTAAPGSGARKYVR